MFSIIRRAFIWLWVHFFKGAVWGTLKRFGAWFANTWLGRLFSKFWLAILFVFDKIWSFLGSLFKVIKGPAGKIFDRTMSTTMMLAKLLIVLQTFVGLASLIVSVISVYFMLGSVWNLGMMAIDPSGVVTSKLRDLLSALVGSGGMEAVMSSADSMFASATSGIITPTLTLSGLLCQLGVSALWNEVISSAISSVTFIVAVRLLLWSANRLRFTWTRSL